MPDHSLEAENDPPTTGDHIRAHPLSLVACLVAGAAAVLIAVDVFVPDSVWVAAYSLTAIPPWQQVLISVLLAGGAVSTTRGVLLRTRRASYTDRAGYRRGRRAGKDVPRPPRRTMAPLETIRIEKLGWLSLAFGWSTVLFAVLSTPRPGNSFVLILVMGSTLAGVVKIVLLSRKEKRIRRGAAVIATATGEIPIVGGAGG